MAVFAVAVLDIADPSHAREVSGATVSRRGIRRTISEKTVCQAARRRKGSRCGRPPGFE
ncbi:hypothetical protein [Streptomyces sp. NPDC016172]|uniref:hypothetical protein n=1 Tax=Streptomyces sp. NPDC016172 TaxID=3364964 RepID=UPI0036F9E645